MDERFPKFLRVAVEKLDFVGIPNLGPLICALAVLGYVGSTMLGVPVERFLFDPELVRQGEWWRLFAYPASADLTRPLWLIFYVLYVYFVMGSLESHWGPGPLTVFTILSYLTTIAGAFIINEPIFIWFYIMENISLAFGTLFPDLQLYLFFVIPVRAKWLAAFAGALLVIQFVSGGLYTKIFLLTVLFPYLLFFGPFLVSNLKLKWKRYQYKKKMGDDGWR